MHPCADSGSHITLPLLFTGIATLKPRTLLTKSVWSSTSLLDESSLWKLPGHQKRPKFDFITNYKSTQASGNTRGKFSCSFFLHRYRLHEQDAGLKGSLKHHNWDVNTDCRKEMFTDMVRYYYYCQSERTTMWLINGSKNKTFEKKTVQHIQHSCKDLCCMLRQ